MFEKVQFKNTGFDQHNGGFIWVYSLNDTELCIMMQMRHDMKLGVPGGKIESTDESVLDGALRELVEETNISLGRDNIARISPLCTYRQVGSQFKSNAFFLNVNQATLNNMINVANDHVVGTREVVGMLRIVVRTWDQWALLQKQNFAYSARAELNELFMKHANLIVPMFSRNSEAK